jgi:uncharacterized protein YecE (DUF72 family)
MGKILIGTAGWSYKDWEGIVYPATEKKRQSLVSYMARYFDTLEINNSFYRPIAPNVARGWARAAEVNPDFLFTAKLYQAFTHAPGAAIQPTSASTISFTDDDEQQTKAGLDEIAAGGRLGAVLIQFPISFKNTGENRAYLDDLIGRFQQYPLVVEVRHDSWNNPDTLRSFAARNVAFCNIDQPLLGKAIRATAHVTSTVGYVRLHGRNYQQWFEHEKPSDRYNYLYSTKELEGWKEKIERVAEQAERTFVVTNNHFKGKAAANALELKAMLTKSRVSAPAGLLAEYPRLRDLAESLPE